MTGRERFLGAAEHRETDRVPVDLGGTSVTTLTSGAYRALTEYLGGGDAGGGSVIWKAFQNVSLPEEILKRFQVDFRSVTPGKPDNFRVVEEEDTTWRDEWGITYRPSAGGLYSDIVRNPLADATSGDLDRYPWPDPDDPGRTRGLAERAKTLHGDTDHAVIGNMTGSQIFERAWYLRGFERFLMDLAADKKNAHALLRKVTDIQIRRTENFLRAVGPYIQVFKTSDDLSGQLRPLISPSLYREMIKPYHREYFDRVRRLTDARILLHCCGNVRPLIPDLIDAGADILHPVQFSCPDMEPAGLKADFGRDLVFWGGMDVQRVLPKLPEPAVRADARRIIDTLGRGGGFVFSPSHNIQADTPPENIIAMYEEGIAGVIVSR
jgi:uroporphyrinogen decarboxylase